MQRVNQKKLLVMALYAGEIMLKNGGETYRVEDTIIRLCKSRNFPFVESYVTPTGIIISVDNEGEDHNEMISYVKRINSRSINLNKINEVNDFSRKFVESSMSLEEAMAKLKAIDQLPAYNLKTRALFGGIASAFVALLFGCNFYEFFAALMTSILVTISLHQLQKNGFNLFITNMAGGSVAALMAILFSIHPAIHVDMVIIGAIMIMVPGVAITNAVRDTISGDLVSGLARGAEAFLIAISIAFGVGFILKTWVFLAGGNLI
ncbi:threonine/serine exporter family protein [Alkaliphilus transvaalensis]|uniref:threonine/serine exporter family protein n=1 Tax=Alkaliphilus transvaalensis TaxID=114628 RepID=UPI00047EA735|nr:threonine/serine exporter family protein [Alkaliphilus transvaalensis]